jgi:cytidylate kinase
MQKKYGEENDNFVLESRLGWFFVPHSFKIQLVCDEPERLRRVCEREGCDIFTAKNDENIRLEAIHERYKKLYGIDDFENENNYDLVIDTTNLSPDEIVNIILEKIKNK